MPSTKNGDWTHYTADMRGTKYSPLDQINAQQLQSARSRVAVQDRQPRHAPRVQARRHAAGDQGRPLHDRRHAPLGGRARRPHRRADLDAQLPRRQPRRDRAAPAVGPRRLVLDRRQGRRPHPLRHHRLSPDRAQRQERRDGLVVRRRRRRRSEEGRGHRQGPADRAGDRRDRPALDADHRRQHRADRLVVQGRHDGRDAQQHQGPGARVRREERQAAVDVQHDSAPRRVRQRHVGKRVVGDQRQHRRVDADHGRRGSRAWSICRSKIRRRTTTAAIGPATTCSATASSAST